ncbi:putative AMP deaminase [Sesbania bispinosa]|nr:putative AMP deaminase [Sesbania bispinosa]
MRTRCIWPWRRSSEHPCGRRRTTCTARRCAVAGVRPHGRAERDGGGSDGVDSPLHSKSRRGGARRRGNSSYRRGSASLPDVTAISGGLGGEEKQNGPLHVEGIPGVAEAAVTP